MSQIRLAPLPAPLWSYVWYLQELLAQLQQRRLELTTHEIHAERAREVQCKRAAISLERAQEEHGRLPDDAEVLTILQA